MKKIFTLSAIAASALNALAQQPNIVTDDLTQTFHDNAVIYMCAPGDNKAVDEVKGLDVNYVKSAYEELGINFQNNDANNTNQLCIMKDYVDSETGAKFPAGYYYPTKVGGSRSYFGKNEGATGVKNVKKMIFYWAAAGNVQFSSYLVREGGITVNNLSTGSPVTVENRYTMDPNCKMKFSVPEPTATYQTTKPDSETGEPIPVEKPIFSSNNYYNTMLDENGEPTTTWTTFACLRPAKLTLDFTTPIPVDQIDTNLDFTSILDGDINVPYGHYEFSLRDENGKDKAGNAIPWSADNVIQQGYKRAAYLLGIAFISGDEGAKTYYANINNSTDDDECYWEESAEAAHTPLADTDDPANNLVYSWMLTDEFKAFVQAHAGAGIQELNADSRQLQTYNVMGQKVQQASGLCIRGGKLIYVK